MSDAGCPHPDPEVVVIRWCDLVLVRWCPLCGSINDDVGAHGAEPGAWRSPTGVVLPGWTCQSCQAFNGCAKELLIECRGCGSPRRST